jgi:DUF1009 family protein
MSDSLGLVGGAGGLPALMAREARRAGWRVVAFALGEPGPLRDAADRVVPCRLGEVGPIFDVLTGERIRHVVLAGGLRKDGLFQGMAIDETARALVDRSPDWTDEALLRTATSALTELGIELLDQRRFLEPWLAPSGLVAGPGAVVAKATAPGHDYRFDVPAVGAATLALCAEGRAAAVAVEAGRVLLLDRDVIAAHAEQAGISLVGVAGGGATD